MPAVLAELLLRRVSGISGPAAAVLAVLAVAARPLPEDDLVTACHVDVATVRDGLRALHRRGLLRSDDAAYELRHQLLAQAVSSDLLPSHRRELHAKLAASIARWSDGSFAAEAAEHYALAGRDEDELDMRVRAARNAERMFAWSDAVRHWQRALALYGPTVPRPGDRELAWAIYAGLHAALWARGDTDHMRALAEQARERLLASSDARQRAGLYARLGSLRGISSAGIAMEVLDECLAACADLPPNLDQLTALREVEGVLRNSGRMAEAEAVLEESISVADAIGDDDARTVLTGMRAWYRMSEGNDAAAWPLLEEMTEGARQARSPGTQMVAAALVTAILLETGRLDEVAAAAHAPLEFAAARGMDDFHYTWVVKWNTTEALTELGRIAEAADLIGPIVDVPPTQRTQRRYMLATGLAMLDGELARSDQRWAAIDALEDVSLLHRLYDLKWRAELDLWLDEPDRAFERAIALLDAARDTDVSVSCGPILTLAARACADRAEAARARRDPQQLEDALHARARLVEVHAGMRIDPLVQGPQRVTAEGDRATWDGELARADGNDTPGAWAGAAAAWESLQRPHRRAYAMVRQAEALLRERGGIGEVRMVLPAAAELAREHVPLHRAITELAGRARVDLGTREAVEPAGQQSPPDDPFALTERERAVLRLVAEGKSNPQIGAALYMSPRTASVHVTHILRKLGVATRAHAATVAQRAGLID